MYQMIANKKSDGLKSRIYRFVENLLLCLLFNLERIRKRKKDRINLGIKEFKE